MVFIRNKNWLLSTDKIWIFVGMEDLFGINDSWHIWLKNNHADANTCTLESGSSDTNDDISSISKFLKDFQTMVGFWNGQFLNERWFVAQNWKFWKENKVYSTSDSIIYTHNMFLNIAFNISFDWLYLSWAKPHILGIMNWDILLFVQSHLYSLSFLSLKIQRKPFLDIGLQTH